jgi:GntR family transcriptional regulator/MocR family aminotransferase
MQLPLDGQGPRFRQLHRALRDAIRSGALGPGERLPATRTLSRELGLSRTTILLAYEQLLSEGLARGRVGSGTYVEESAAAPPRRASVSASAARERPLRLSATGAAIAAARARPLQSAYLSERPVLRFDFRYGQPSLLDFPIATWQRRLGRRLRRASARALDYGPPQGSTALRRALADYLGRSRGLVCDPEQILVVSGSQQGVDLVARLVLRRRDRAALEEPGYEGARAAFDAAGASLVPVPIDAEGIRVDALPRRGVRLVFVTPAHQYPLGVTMSYPRRAALLAWAERTGALVLEDDYDGEYRDEGWPREALMALDRGGVVLHLGTFSKVMFPALRIGYLVLPPRLVEPCARLRVVSDGGAATLEQDALADFLQSGDFERHVRRSRARSRKRRETLLAALRDRLGDQAEVQGGESGLHVVLWLRGRPPREAREIAQRARERGVGLYPISPYYAGRPPAAGFVMGYAALTPETIRDGVARIAELLTNGR